MFFFPYSLIVVFFLVVVYALIYACVSVPVVARPLIMKTAIGEWNGFDANETATWWMPTRLAFSYISSFPPLLFCLSFVFYSYFYFTSSSSSPLALSSLALFILLRLPLVVQLRAESRAHIDMHFYMYTQQYLYVYMCIGGKGRDTEMLSARQRENWKRKP